MTNLEKNIQEYISGKEYSKDILKKFIMGYVKDQISDNLMTKFLKSIFDIPLSTKSISDLAEIMMHSGDVINLNDIPGITLDKHSTGGVGDKVTIIVSPIVASLGGYIAKMSGRGLGFTGGTLDKLESIPGYNIFLTDKQFKNNLLKNKISIIGQTKNLVPADKKIYALRDETNLISSLSLISSSIMAKKLATGADAILIDVKIGDGAFMKTQKQGEELAKSMINIGKSMKKDVKVEITSMETPLGYEIGNKNEIIESINFLKGKKPAHDLKEVVYCSASIMLMQAKIFNSKKDAINAIDQVINNGKAFEKFKDWIQSQGGNLKKLFENNFWTPKYKHKVKALKSGYFNIKSAINFGLLAMMLGAGREKKEDKIDFDAGISLKYKTGDAIKKDDVLFILCSSNPIPDKYKNYLNNSFEILKNKKIKKTILNKL